MTANSNQTLTELLMSYNHLDTSKDDKRLIAVTAALELIKSDASGGNTELSEELKNLGKYADSIQKAIKP